MRNVGRNDMKHRIIKLLLIFFGFYLLTFLMFNRGSKSFLIESNYNLSIPLYATLLLIVTSLFASLIIKIIIINFINQSTKTNSFFNILVWTNFIFFIVLIFLKGFDSYKTWYFNNYQANIVDREFYKDTFRNSAKKDAILAIEDIEKKQKSSNDYGIISFYADTKDSLIKGETKKYIVVNQVYFIGKKANKDNLFATRQLISPDKQVLTIYNIKVYHDRRGLVELNNILNDAKKMDTSIKMTIDTNLR